MKVCICIPAGSGTIHAKCHFSLVNLYHCLRDAGIDYDEFIVENCPCLSVARNTLVAMFMADSEATDLFFIDSDEKFDPKAVLEILKRPEGVIGGVYPLKRDSGGWPVKIKMQDGVPIGREGLIEAELLPTGFMRIKREVIESMIEAYPELKYDSSVIEISGEENPGAYDLFGMGVLGIRFRTEDFAFCQRWTDLGGKLWVYPDVTFEHIGAKSYVGNYHEYLAKLPGGAWSDTAKANATPGWMSVPELDWLAQQAKKRTQIVEIGSWMGRSTRALADNTQGEVIAVDTWEGSEQHSGIMKEITPDALFKAFQSCTADLENVRAMRMPSTVAARLFLDRKFDMVFIDGAHDYESVKADIEAWRGFIARGGIMCGHDFSWPEVKKAVTELLPNAVAIPGTDIWATLGEVNARRNENTRSETNSRTFHGSQSTEISPPVVQEKRREPCPAGC